MDWFWAFIEWFKKACEENPGPAIGGIFALFAAIVGAILLLNNILTVIFIAIIVVIIVAILYQNFFPKGMLPYIPRPYPIHKNFTGRKEERKMLSEWFENGNKPLLALIAMGGMGKSSLAWYWSQEDIIKQKKVPEGLLWWSFYDTESGFENFVDAALKYVSGKEVSPEEDKSLRDKMSDLYNLLCQHRFLLILDGVERLLRAYAGQSGPYKEKKVKKGSDGCSFFSPQVGQFFQDLANTKSKILLTSRIFPREFEGVDGQPLEKFREEELPQFSIDDALDFFHRQDIDWHRGEVEQVCQKFGYLPLHVRLFTGFILKRGKTQSNPAKIIDKLVVKKQSHNIFEIAYQGLSDEQQIFISKLAAFRSAMDYEVISIFKPTQDEDVFYDMLSDLTNRGLLLRDKQKYDLHPSIREYCYVQLKDKTATHTQLAEYFAEIPVPDKPEKLEDLTPLIELYHHTLRAGDYDKACDLLYEKLDKPLYFDFGAYQLSIELFLGLFPDGEDKLPCLKKKSDQGWTLNNLARCYGCSGQPRHSVPVLKNAIKMAEDLGDQSNQAAGLGNLAQDQMSLGELEDAQANLQRRVQICQEIGNRFKEAIGHQELGRLLAYRGNWPGAEGELEKSTKYWRETDNQQGICLDESYRSLAALLQGDFAQALKSAQEAHKIAKSRKNESDIVRAAWVLGAAYRGNDKLAQAEKHINQALSRCRKINLVDIEADILLELARVRRGQVVAPFMGQPSADKSEQQLAKDSLMNQATTLAQEALKIADRCEYRLKQADIHLFLAQLALDGGDKARACTEAQIAKERAACGYKPTLDQANQFLERLR